MLTYLTDAAGLFYLVLWAGTAALVLHDISKYSDLAWKELGESKLVWQVIGAALAWPIGSLVYFFALRPKLEGLAEEDKMKRWMEEYDARRAAAGSGSTQNAGNVTPAAPTTVEPQGLSATDQAQPVTHVESYPSWNDHSNSVAQPVETVATSEPVMGDAEGVSEDEGDSSSDSDVVENHAAPSADEVYDHEKDDWKN